MNRVDYTLLKLQYQQQKQKNLNFFMDKLLTAAGGARIFQRRRAVGCAEQRNEIAYAGKTARHANLGYA